MKKQGAFRISSIISRIYQKLGSSISGSKLIIINCSIILNMFFLCSHNVYSQYARHNKMEDKIEKLFIQCSEGHEMSCIKISEIAKNDKQSDVRMTAIKRITDQKIIIDIARNDNNFYVRNFALGCIFDTTLLPEIAKSAIEEVTDQYDLIRIAEHPNWNVYSRIAAINKITDDKVLAEIAKEADNNKVRKSAINKISDQLILKELANYDKNSYIREESVKMITDQNILIELIKDAEFTNTKETALSKIEDHNVLVDIAKNYKDIQIRRAAIWKITDQNVLISLAKNDTNNYIRRTAVKKISDQNILADIAMQDNDSEVQHNAILGINDQLILKEIINKVKNYAFKDAIIETAVHQITDQNVLLELAKNDDEDFTARRAAVEKITDQNILIDMAKKNDFLSKEAVKKITDQKILAEIVRNNPFACYEAIKNIRDDKILIELVGYLCDTTFIKTEIIDIAIKNIDDPTVLIEIAINKKSSYLLNRAIEEINNDLSNHTDLDNIANNEEVIELAFQYVDLFLALFDKIEAEEHCEQLLNAIPIRKNMSEVPSSMAVLISLKAIQCDTILKKYFSYLEILPNIHESSTKYRNVTNLIERDWRYFDYTIDLKTNVFNKTYKYPAKRAGYYEEFVSSSSGIINIYEIFEDLLSHVTKDDLMKISATSDIFYLRKTAKNMLEKHK